MHPIPTSVLLNTAALRHATPLNNTLAAAATDGLERLFLASACSVRSSCAGDGWERYKGSTCPPRDAKQMEARWRATATWATGHPVSPAPVRVSNDEELRFALPPCRGRPSSHCSFIGRACPSLPSTFARAMEGLTTHPAPLPHKRHSFHSKRTYLSNHGTVQTARPPKSQQHRRFLDYCAKGNEALVLRTASMDPGSCWVESQDGWKQYLTMDAPYRNEPGI